MSFVPSPIDAPPSSTLPAWHALGKTAVTAKQRSLADYFQTAPERAETLSYALAGLQIDLSRHHLDTAILEQLLALADQAGLSKAIDALYSGKPVNHTEGRPALHMALRGPVGSAEIQQEVSDCHHKMAAMVEKLLSGQWLGYSGKAISTVINIGIGGSDLGPRCVCEALKPYHNNTLDIRFVANIDPSDLEQTLQGVDPETTLFIIASKSFSTPETLTNALSARDWLGLHAGQDRDLSPHFIAISSRVDRATDFGVNPQHILPMWDWVGGRYSLWSAIGLPIALATSFKTFQQLLAGAEHVDQHFSSSPLSENIPTLLALLEIWYVNFWDCDSVAVLPYDHDLRLLPDHLQQLTMESNGKQVNRNGQSLNYQTSPVLWGSAGTIGQHSFHQLLHQGTRMIPVDFILPLSSHVNKPEQHTHMVANCLAQAQTLMDGQGTEQVSRQLSEEGLDPEQIQSLTPHKLMPGNRPSTIITTERLTPESLGAIIALYEHKTFAASVLLGINAFDQWGVELGKKAASDIYEALLSGKDIDGNPATAAGIKLFRTLNKKT